MPIDTYDRAKLNAELSIDEGRRASPYLDSQGISTVGIGHNLAAGPLPSQTYPMTDAQIDALFDRDIASSIAKLDKYLPWWRTLDPVRQRVLINMTFNLGMGTPGSGKGLLSFGGFLGYVRMGDYAGAAKDMLGTLWARQVGKRANRLSDMMLNGTTDPAKPPPTPFPPLPRPTPVPPAKPASTGLAALVQAIIAAILKILGRKL